MITVIFRNIAVNGGIDPEKSENIFIEFSGHSGSGIKGNDIVCSAVSVLVHTFSQTAGKILKIRQEIQRSNGYFSTLIKMNELSPDDKLGLRLLMNSLLIGLAEISREYPDRIKIEFEND